MAQFAGFVRTPDAVLFTHDATDGGADGCAGARRASLWCVIGPHHDPVARILTAAVFLLVVSGVAPRWTCVPHWYVTFSLALSMQTAYGADAVATVATLLMIPMLLGDTRLWPWGKPGRALPAVWRGRSYAAWWFMRIQIAVIYGNAALAKLAEQDWRRGTAMRAVLADPEFGWSHHGGGLGVLQRSPALIGAVTWGTMVVEAAIAMSALAPWRWRRRAVVLAVALHAGIIVVMHLVEFGTVMIAFVSLLALRSGVRPPREDGGILGTVEARRSATVPALLEE